MKKAKPAAGSGAPGVPKAYGAMLIKLGESIGLKRPELAKSAGMSDLTAWRVESGGGAVKAAHALRQVLVSRGLEVPPVPVGDADWRPSPPVATPTPRDEDEETIRQNLIRFREATNHDQFSAASASGIPYEDLCAYERGDQPPPNAVLKRLGEVYGHGPGDFFERSPPPANADAVQGLWWRGIPEVVRRISDEDKRRLDDLLREIRDKYHLEKKGVIEHIKRASQRRRP